MKEIKNIRKEVHNNKMKDFTYVAAVLKVYDGDTITVDLDLGFNILFKTKLRLYGINAPEMRGKEKKQGTRSRDWLRRKILGKFILVYTFKDKKGKYGRYLAKIYMPKKLTTVNSEMVNKGYAKEAKY